MGVWMSLAGPRTRRSVGRLAGLAVAAAMAASAAPVLAQAQELSIYSAQGEEIYGPILKKFAEKYPSIKVTIVAGSAGEMLQRVKAEAGRPGGDVLLGGPIQSYDVFADLFESYKSPEDAVAIVTDPDSKWHAFSIFAQPLLVSTKRVGKDDMPSKVTDLLDPKWEKLGGIVLADPSQSGTGYTIIAGLANGLGWDTTTKIVKAARAVPGSTPMFNAVRDGEAAVGWVNEDLGVKWEAEGLPVKMIYPSDATTVQIDGYGLIKGARNADSAKKFIDFVGSKDVQAIVTSVVKRRSARKDVPPPGDMKSFGDLKLFPAREPNDVITAKFKQIKG